ncbi:MAG TPA: long-chain fatty acid--CoA ligase [Aliidongia sp.]|nr:long-chain fatty acid--CoA ligase [Aliidongia sp.]
MKNEQDGAPLSGAENRNDIRLGAATALSYPANISWSDPFEIVPVPALLDRSVARYGARPCLDFLDRKFTYEEVGQLVDRAARGLQNLGLGKGDRVGLFLPNCPYAVIMLFAVLKAGGIVVNFNPLYAPREVRHQIEDSVVRFMVTLDLPALYCKLAPMLDGTALEKIILCPMQGVLPFPQSMLYPLLRRADIVKIPADGRHVTFEALTADRAAPAPVECDPVQDVALLQYTGGTTGVPKGAMLSHRNIVVNCQQCLRWFPEARLGREKVLAVLPFFHVFALTVAEMLSILGGFEIILLPRFELKQVLKTIERKRPTMFPGVPTIYTAINSSPGIGRRDLSSIKYCLSGGAPLPLEVKTEFERLTGCHLAEGYGLSETSPVATANPLDAAGKPGSIGLPVPGTEIEIASLERPDETLPPGERGEVCVRGPQVMLGYWRQPDATAAILTDGRLRTGDVGYIDEDGYVFLVDRIKDLIIAGGYNVYPRNVEEAIYAHPAIAECVVIGLPDPYRGQTVKAYVTLRAGMILDEAMLRTFLEERLSPMEMPKLIEFRDALPKTAIGKLSKKALLDEEAAKTAAAAA